ncbi:MAG: hypothetical protein RMX65_000090 [Nostoc sp. DedQUE01]|nr:hypothetical protein [Nostoc sp. DedQUE01]
MTEIEIEIQGENAIDATKSLLSIQGISGNYSIPEAAEREPLLTTIATIITIIGGSLAIAEQIRKWYEEHKKRHSLDKAVIIFKFENRRVLLIGDTIDDRKIKEIVQIIEDFQKFSNK